MDRSAVALHVACTQVRRETFFALWQGQGHGTVDSQPGTTSAKKGWWLGVRKAAKEFLDDRIP